ncbi:24803_t:CDS:2, partial [Racocetra persica]
MENDNLQSLSSVQSFDKLQANQSESPELEYIYTSKESNNELSEKPMNKKTKLGHRGGSKKMKLGLMEKLGCSTNYPNKSIYINFEITDLVFDDNVGFVVAQKKEEDGSKERKIKINSPINITNMQHKIKNTLYDVLLHYWDLSNNELFLAYLLDL